MISIDNLVSFISTKELKGNFIKLIKFNYIQDGAKRCGFIFKSNIFIHYSQIFSWFKENFLDRVYEYFFGYYKHPLKTFIPIFEHKKNS